MNPPPPQKPKAGLSINIPKQLKHLKKTSKVINYIYFSIGIGL